MSSPYVRDLGGTSADEITVYTITDPAVNAAVTAGIVGGYDGVIITLTTTGNAQTLQTPSTTSVQKRFTVMNNDTSTNAITVNGVSLAVGSAKLFVWDGTSWITTSNTYATTSSSGVVELATDEETVVGVSALLVTTPSTLVAKMAAPGGIGVTTASLGNFTKSHITTLNVNSITATTFSGITSAHITTITTNSLTATTANFPTSAHVTTLTSNSLNATTGHIITFTSNNVNATTGHAGTFTTNSLNATTGHVGTFTSNSVTASNITIGDAGKIIWDIAPASDVTAIGNQSSETSGSTVAFGDVLYKNVDGSWYLADADSSTTMPAMKVAVATISAGNAGNMLSQGVLRNDTWDWIPGLPVYVATTGTTGNTLTQTVPTGDGDIIQPIGYAVTADVIAFNPTPIMTEYTLDIEAKNTGYAITWAELNTSYPKTFTCDSASDRTFTFGSVPSSSDVGKSIQIIKSGTDAGKVTITAPAGVSIDDSGAAGSIYCDAALRASITLKLATATQLVITSAFGTWTTASA